jgi:hypothetical protein
MSIQNPDSHPCPVSMVDTSPPPSSPSHIDYARGVASYLSLSLRARETELHTQKNPITSFVSPFFFAFIFSLLPRIQRRSILLCLRGSGSRQQKLCFSCRASDWSGSYQSYLCGWISVHSGRHTYLFETWLHVSMVLWKAPWEGARLAAFETKEAISSRGCLRGYKFIPQLL